MTKWLTAMVLLPFCSTQAATSDQRFATTEDWLAAHNAERALVSVPPLRWSAAAETQAKNWAAHLVRKKQFEHSSGAMGENLFASSYYHPPKAKEVVANWAEEKHDFDRDTRKCK